MNGVATAALEAIGRGVAGHTVQRLIGYWAMWHIAGGLDPLIETGWMAKSNVYAQRRQFRRVFGVDVEDFLPEQAHGLGAWREQG